MNLFINLTTKSEELKSMKTSCDSTYSIYEKIGSLLPEVKIPSNIEATVERDSKKYKIIYSVSQRGNYIKNGERLPSMYVVTTTDDYIRDYENELNYKDFNECYLTCINPESNNYKSYHMIPTKNGIDVIYGRIGADSTERFGERHISVPYKLSLYWIRYYEKLSKGYIDNSSVYLKKDKRKQIPSQVSTPKTPESCLYETLMVFSKEFLSKNLISSSISEGQIIESKKIFRQLCERKTVRGFNNQLLKLIQISPRKLSNVNDALAKKVEDFESIISREEALINSMIALIGGNKNTLKFREDIEIYYATDAQRKEVLGHLNTSLHSKVKNIYRVIPKKQKERFDKYLKENKITKIKQLWHGSKNANWISIIENSLSPSAGIAHGRMFGNGVYFAPSSMKSWNYTSYHGTYWAKGTEDVAFMGLYATAYGEPLNCNSSFAYTKKYLKQQNKNCVHAHAGPYLKNDEIIFYDENSVLLNYLVEFR